MSLAAFQKWLVEHGARLAVDGMTGPATRSAIIETFRNRAAPAVTIPEIKMIADRLGCSIRQLNAVFSVEASGAGWDRSGLLTCLWERHYLFKRIRIAVPFLSNPVPGGYTIDADGDGINDSWERLADAAMRWGPEVAFECASFGKPQIMGAHWKSLGYRSALDFVWQLTRDERAHYEAFARFIEVNGLKSALRSISSNPDSAREFAHRYNGPGYAKGRYHEKIAAAFGRAA